MRHTLSIALPLLGLMLLFGMAAGAEDAARKYRSLYFEGFSCGAYVQARQQPNGRDAFGFSSWLTGYVTAMNENLPQTYDLSGSTDLAGMLGWLDNYCRANPTKSFVDATAALATFLYPTRKQSAGK